MINKVIKLKLLCFIHAYVQATCQIDPEVYATRQDPKIYPHTKFRILPQIIYRYALSSTLLELKPEVKVTVTRKHLVTRQGPRCIYITNMECYHKYNRRSAVGAFFQELIPEIKVTASG